MTPWPDTVQWWTPCPCQINPQAPPTHGHVSGAEITPPPRTEDWDDLPIAMPIAGDSPPPIPSPTGQQIPIAAPLSRSDPPPLRPEPVHATPGVAKVKPKPPHIKPADRYRRWLQKQLAGQKVNALSTSKLQELLGYGGKQIGLSPCYAEDILVEICRDQSISLPTEQPRVDDKDVLLFVEYCQEVLAVEGGVTPQARVKMDAKAAELKLTPQQREQSVGLLDTKVEPNRLARRTKAFEQFLSESFAKTKKVGPTGYHRLEQTGVEVFGLKPEVAARSITTTAKERSVSILTKDTAAELLDRSIAAVINDQTSLDSAAKDKLLQEGQRIGLSRSAVIDRIESTLQSNREKHKQNRQRDNFLVLCVAFVIAATILAVGAGVYLLTRKDQPAPIAQPADPEPTETSPAWWNPELILAVAEAKQQLPDATVELESLGSKIVVARRQACQALVRRYCQLLADLGANVNHTSDPFGAPDNWGRDASRGRPDQASILSSLETVLVQAYVVESDQRTRDIWRQELFKSFSTSPAESLRDQRFELMFRKLSLAEDVINSPDVDAGAKTELVSFLNERIPPDPTSSGAEADDFRRRLTIQLRDQFTGDSTDIDLDYQNFRAILSSAAQTMSADQSKELSTEMLFQILPTLNTSLGGFEPDLRRRISRGDGVLLSRFVDTYERMKPGNAQAELGRLLTDAVNLPVNRQLSPDALALAIREKLLETPSPAGSQSDQLRFWQQQTRLMLSQPRADADDTADLLQESAELALHLAIGEAILETTRQTEGNAAALLEELRNLGEFTPPSPNTGSVRTRTTSNQLSAIYQQRFYQYIDMFKQSRDVRRRTIALNMIFSSSTYIDEISPELAADLVEYTLTLKPQEEHQLIIQNIGKWMRWKYYRLALADAVAGVTLPPARAAALLNPLLGTEIDTTDPNWKTDIRVELMQWARDRLGGGTTSSDLETRTIDAAGEYLTEILQLKGRLRGYLPDPQQTAIPTPGRVLLATTKSYAQRLSAAASEPVAQQLISRASRRREMVAFLTNNDLGQTVTLQRAYLCLLAADLIEQHPAAEANIQELLLQLDTLDRDAKSLPEQVRNGELFGIKLLQARSPSL